VIDPKIIKARGEEFGIDEIRITTADPFFEAKRKIIEQIDQGLYLDSERWVKRDIVEFCDVHHVLTGARSIIAACQCYLTNEDPDLGRIGNPHGLVARYTWRNHYLDLRNRLEKLAHFIAEKWKAVSTVYSNGPLAEKPIAQRCGLGYYGKHSIVINRKYGSWVVLGEIITDIEVEPDRPIDIDCGDCRRCIESCPTGAIIKPYVIDRRRCIQALTNWYGVIPLEIARVWGNRLYGCTACQDVCPENHRVKPGLPRTSLGYVGSSLPLLDILRMDEREYRLRYSNNQITAPWINFKAIKRNSILALGNIGDKSALKQVARFTRDEDEILAKTALSAIANFAED
jgi:epoxyqueuosine reductase